MKPNKQKTDWDDRVEELLVKCEQMYLTYKEYNGTLENLCKLENEVKDFISKTLQQQRKEIIKEIEGIVGVDTGGTGQVYFYKKQLRKQIRERLKQL